MRTRRRRPRGALSLTRYPGLGLGAGAIFSPLSLSPALWLKADAGLVTDGAAGFATASSQSLDIASNSTLQTGGGDFWLACWCNMTTQANGTLVSKGSFAGFNNADYSLEFSTTGMSFRFTAGTGSGSQTVTDGTISAAGTWFFVLAWYDSVAGTVNVQVNNGTVTSASLGGTPVVTTSAFALGRWQGAGNYLNGNLDSVAFGKAPPGGIAGILGALRTSLYNGGSGKLYDQLTAAEQSAWGLVSWYDLGEQTSAQRNDRVGTNHLTQSGGVTLTAGIASGAALYDGDPVATWQDQSGNANHATQATATKRALLKLAIQNGLPVVRSDGVDDFLALASRAWFPSKRGWFAGVWKLGASGNRLLSTLGAGVPFVWYTTTSGTAYKWHDAVSDLTDAANDPAAFFQQSVNRIGDTTLEVYTNGGSLNTLTLANNQPSATTLSIAANQTGTSPAALDIGELIGGDGALSAANRVALEGYLRSRWGTP